MAAIDQAERRVGREENSLPDDRRTRVLVLGSYGPSLEVFRGSLISAMVAQGCEVHAMAADIDDAVEARLVARGATVHRIAINRTGVNPLSLAGLLSRLAQAFRRIEPDVVIAYTIKPVVFGALANRNARFVAVITGLGYAFTGGGQFKRRVSAIGATLLYRLALARADVILFQNPDDLAQFRALRIVPRAAQVGLLAGSGVELDRFSPTPLPGETRFLMAARLLGDKGVREFGFASARVIRECPEARIALAGFFDDSPDSIEAAELTAMIDAGVAYLGHVDDIRPAISDCSVYVLPSYREGTPRSVLEAMAMGRAIITTDAPGCRETVEHGRNGLLVPPRDGEALAIAMLELARDPERVARMGIESRRIAQEKFDVTTVNSRIMQVASLA